MDSLATQQRENVIKRREKNKKHSYTGEIEYVQISRKERKKLKTWSFFIVEANCGQ
jgi:hypothetical protein